MTPQKYIDAVLRIKARQAEYDSLNTSIKDVQGHDYYTHLNPIDDYLLETVLDCLDDALFFMTDVKELASYYIYERMNAYKIKTHEQEYIWRTGEEFKECVLRMIKDKPAATDPQTVRALIDEVEKYKAALEGIKWRQQERVDAIREADPNAIVDASCLIIASEALKGTDDE